MTKEDEEVFVEILDFLASGLGPVEMTPVKYKFYYSALSDLSIEDIKTAANHIARTATFFPKPVDFRNSIQGDMDALTIGAWEKVLKAKAKAGQYQSVKFDDFAIHSAIKLMGGWGAVCRLEGHDDEKWQRVEFEKVYKAMQGKMGHPDYLPGISEVENAARGFDDGQEVMLIASGEMEVKQIGGG